MIKRLRVKFVCVNMALVLGMLLVIFGLVYHFTRTSLEDATLSALKSAAAAQLWPGRPGTVSPEQSVPCFTLETGPWGELIVAGSAYFDLTDEALLADIYRQVQETGLQSGVLEGYDLRFYRADPPGTQRYAFADISAQRDTLGALVGNCVLIGLISMAGFLGISIALAFWAVRPVEAAWKQQRQFVADASHELKTPLTVILTNAELLQSGEYGPEEKRQFSDSILAMSRQMRGLVEGLLELARADNGQVRAHREPVALSQLVEDALLPFEPVYFEQGLTLCSRVMPDITVAGSGTHLRQVVDILLDNGRKYSAPGGTVWLTLERSGRGKCLLTVTTPGETLTEQECRDVFKRFYRADAARSTNGSYGLGLSIAQRIVEEHGGRIWAQGKAGHNSFFVSLPE